MTSHKPPASKPYKIPVSVLVLIHTRSGEVLLIERADRPGFWQSVTGSQDAGETLHETAVREVREETGIQAPPQQIVPWEVKNEYEIYAYFRHRYAPGTTHNTEHVFALRLEERVPVTLSPQEHTAYVWLPWREAAAKVTSWSNRDAILLLEHRL